MIETGAINLKKERERWERKGIFFKIAPDLFFEKNEIRRRKKKDVPTSDITFFSFRESIPMPGFLASFPVTAWNNEEVMPRT